MRARDAPIRIAHVATVDATLEVLLRPQVDYLRSCGYDVEMVASAGPHTADLRRDGLVVHNTYIPRHIEAKADMAAAVQLVRLFRRGQYDVVHTHTSKAGFVGRLAAWLARVPMIVHTAHGFYFHEGMSSRQRRIFETVERIAGYWTDLLFLQSAEDYDYVKRHHLIPAARARHLGNGIDLEQFDRERLDDRQAVEQKRDSLIGKGDYFLVLMAADMIERKGHIYLLRALELLQAHKQRLRVVLAGDGPLEADLKDFARAHGVAEMVRFIGYREDVAQLLSACDMYVLPSLSEGMPRSIIEAMALGRPVLASNIRGSRELIVDGVTGLLVPPKDEQSLAAAIAKLMDEPKLRARMGNAGRERALSEFDERQVFSRLQAGYQGLLRERGYVDDVGTG